MRRRVKRIASLLLLELWPPHSLFFVLVVLLALMLPFLFL